MAAPTMLGVTSGVNLGLLMLVLTFSTEVYFMTAQRYIYCYGFALVRGYIEDINISVKENEFISLLGPSGCGKSTLLTIMAGFQKADSGVVETGGKIVTKPGPDRAFVFQNYALFPWMTLKANILYPMKRQKLPLPERTQLLKKLLSMAKLDGKENLFPHQLSGGMKQRTAVIRALACRPEVMLMDEPLGALDYQMRRELQEELEAIFLQDAVTVVMVSHASL